MGAIRGGSVVVAVAAGVLVLMLLPGAGAPAAGLSGRAAAPVAAALASPTVVTTVTVPGSLGAPVYDPTNGQLYVPDLTSGDLLAVDAATGTVLHQLPRLAAHGATLAVDPTNGSVYVADGHQLAIVNVHDRVVAWVPLAWGAVALAIDPVANELFAASGAHPLTVVALGNDSVVAQIPVLCRGASWHLATYPGYYTGVVYDPSTGWVDAASSWYSASSQAGGTCTSAIDPAQGNVVLHTHFSSYGFTGQMVVAPNLDRLYMLNNQLYGGFGGLEALSASTTRYAALFYPHDAAEFGAVVTGLAVDGPLHTLLAVDTTSPTGAYVSTMGLMTGNVTGWVSVAADPVGLALDERTDDAWVVNGSPGMLTEIAP